MISASSASALLFLTLEDLFISLYNVFNCYELSVMALKRIDSVIELKADLNSLS